MKSSLAGRLSKLGSVVAVAAAALCAPVASAGPAIGFDPTGAGNFTALNPFASYSDLWTNFTDSALSIGFVPNTPVTLGNPASYYTTELTAQARVNGMQLIGVPVINPGLNVNNTSFLAAFYDAFGVPRFELTKVLRVQELVISQTNLAAIFTAGPTQPDIDTATAGSQQLMVFFDRFAAGDNSFAVPGDGVGTVRNYGAGPTSTAASDGKLILSGRLVSAASSFSVDPLSGGNLGTGSFDLRFVIDYVDNNYLDIATNSIFGDKLTGSINVPSQFTPNQAWDGTLSAGLNKLLLKVDSSESFIQAVPEPGSLALVGLALLGAGLVHRRKVS